MTPDEARYHRASRAARAAWEATQPQLALTWESHEPYCPRRAGSVYNCWCGLEPQHHNAYDPSGLDDGPLTAGGETPYSPSGPTLSGTRTGAIIEPTRKGKD